MSLSNAEHVLKALKDNKLILSATDVEKRLSDFFYEDTEKKENVPAPTTVAEVMEVDGITKDTPISDFRKESYRPYLLASEMTNVLKQRFINPSTDELSQNLVFDEGIIPRAVGSIHRPRLIDLCGSIPIEISTSPLVRNGRVGKWKPMEPGNFRHALGEEVMRFRPQYIESGRGYFYKYAFGLDISGSVAREDITVSALSRWMHSVLLEVETQMFQQYYDSTRTNADVGHLTTQDLEAELRGDTYEMDMRAWRKLHRSFADLHGMTDIFVDETQEDCVHDLPIGNGAVVIAPASDNFIDLRNRLADGTYVWSQFIRQPQENVYVCVDRQSSCGFYIVTGSEINERQVSILPDVVTIVFSITVGFEVIDERGVKVVNVTTT